MTFLEGKTEEEKRKIIIAAVLGVLALLSLYIAFGGSFFGGGTRTTVTDTASPTPTPGSARRDQPVTMPSGSEQNFLWTTTPVDYRPGSYGAPDPGRNIFAFYEPPPPTPWTPTPTPIIIRTPIPTPTPPLTLAFITPQMVFAGSRTFRIEAAGDKFTPDARIYFNQIPLQTTFISPQRLAAEVPANLIATQGPKQIIIQTPDGRFYSNQIMLNVQAPPTPQFQYVGMIARRLANNDTAVFREQGRPTEFAARLNDVVGGRFRVMSISSEEVILEDTNLGFRHKLELFRPPPGTLQSTLPPPGRLPPGARPPGFEQGFPANVVPGTIPGIPQNPRIPNTNQAQPQQNEKKDEDGEDTDG
jgi:hypothetical protein